MTIEQEEKQIIQYKKNLEELIQKEAYKQAQIELTKMIRYCEDIFRKTCFDRDRNRLIDCYEEMANYFEKGMFTSTMYSSRELAIRWYERMVHLFERKGFDHLSMAEKERDLSIRVKALRLALDENHSFIKKELNHTITISYYFYQSTKNCEQARFYLLTQLVKRDYYERIKRHLSCYFLQKKILRELYAIEKKAPSVAIKNDILVELEKMVTIVMKRKGHLILVQKWKQKLEERKSQYEKN